jgi:hypothetical protein
MAPYLSPVALPSPLWPGGSGISTKERRRLGKASGVIDPYRELATAAAKCH